MNAPRSKAGRNRESGLSLIEVSVTLLLLSIAMALFYDMILSSLRASMFSESHNDLSVIAQRVTNTIHTEVTQAKLVFQEDTLGIAYRDKFNTSLPSGTTVFSNSRMPIIDQNTTIIGVDPGPDSITNRTGNSLLIVRQLSPLSISWDHDANAGTANITFLADRYVFEYYFLRSNTRRDFGGLGYYLEVMQAKSQEFGDYFQLNDITTNKAQVAAGVRSVGGITMAWDPGKTLAAPGFYNIDVSGAMSGNASPTINLTVKSLVPEFAGGRVSGKMDFSIAPNPTTTLKFKDAVPMYATSSTGFPQGLEFQVVGSSGSRKILTRVVLASNYSQNCSSQESSVTSSARGF
jgi:prepilin-type N-terminal cleavage/methylation domain-containing protein